MVDFSILIPVYNESDKISATITQIVSFMRSFTPSFEIVIVNDGSTDTTAEIVKKYALETPEILFLEYGANRGKGYAIWYGIQRTSGNYILQTDADLSAPISELKKLFVWISDHSYDIVIGSREGTGARRVGEPLMRHVMGRVFNIAIQVLASPGIKDTQCGFKLFKRKVALEIFPKFQVYGSSATTKRPYMGAYDVELLYIAKKLGYKVKEVPVLWTYVKTTRLNHFQDSLKMLRDVFKIRLNDIRGKYVSK